MQKSFFPFEKFQNFLKHSVLPADGKKKTTYLLLKWWQLLECFTLMLICRITLTWNRRPCATDEGRLSKWYDIIWWYDMIF